MLEEIAVQKKLTLPALIAHIDRKRSLESERAMLNAGSPDAGLGDLPSLASTLRVYVVRWLRDNNQ